MARRLSAHGAARLKRQEAIDNGEEIVPTVFTREKPCKVCGGDHHYIMSGKCVACATNIKRTEDDVVDRQFNTRMRKEAMESGDMTFIASPCKSCTGTSRYTKSGRCVTCEKFRSRRVRQATFVSNDSVFVTTFNTTDGTFDDCYDLCPLLSGRRARVALSSMAPGSLTEYGMNITEHMVGADIFNFPKVLNEIRQDALRLSADQRTEYQRFVLVYLTPAAIKAAFNKRN